MGWTVKFTQDTETDGLGTLIAMEDDFVYNRRCNTKDKKDVAAFVAEAKADFVAKSSEKQVLIDIITPIEKLLNTL